MGLHFFSLILIVRVAVEARPPHGKLVLGLQLELAERDAVYLGVVGTADVQQADEDGHGTRESLDVVLRELLEEVLCGFRVPRAHRLDALQPQVRLVVELVFALDFLAACVLDVLAHTLCRVPGPVGAGSGVQARARHFDRNIT